MKEGIVQTVGAHASSADMGSPPMPSKDRPIIFSGPMVRALLEGRKTQTRRLATSPLRKCQAGDQLYVRESFYLTDDGDFEMAVPTADADRVQRHLAAIDEMERKHPGDHWAAHRKGHPSIHMPRWASRLTLMVTEVRCRRLQDIAAQDAIAEGLYKSVATAEDRLWFIDNQHEEFGSSPSEAEIAQFMEGVWMAPGVRQGWGMTKAERDRDQWGPTPEFCFKLIWDSLHTKSGETWADNPEIVALTFTVEHRNIDEARATTDAGQTPGLTTKDSPYDH